MAPGMAMLGHRSARSLQADSSHPLRLRAVVSAIEPGGRAVRDDVRIAYRPNDRYLGIKPAFEDGASPEGKPAAFEVVSVDRAGAQKAGQDQLAAGAHRLEV